MTAADCLRTSIELRLSPEDAFRVFTEQTDAWWKRGPKYRPMTSGAIRFEPGVGGRLVQRDEQGEEYELGRILAWEPGRLLEFEWRLEHFERGQLTKVKVSFEAIGKGTLLRLEHRGWDTLPPDHPARHSRVGAEFVQFRTEWWDGLFAGLAAHIEPGELQ